MVGEKWGAGRRPLGGGWCGRRAHCGVITRRVVLGPRRSTRGHRVGASSSPVFSVAILLALVGMVAFYVEHTALDEDGFETISRNMIENDEIRTQVAAKSVDVLFQNVDVEAAIAERLPPAQQGLAPVSPVSPARAPIGRPTPPSSGHVCRRCGGGDDADPASAGAPPGR